MTDRLEGRLSEFLDGELTRDENALVERHLSECDSCRATLADLGAVYLMILGLVAIVIMLRAPKGIWGFVRERTGLDLFALSRRVVTRSAPAGRDNENKENADEPQAT